MTSAHLSVVSVAVARPTRQRAPQLLGLVIASVIPALFWTFVAIAVAGWFGAQLDALGAATTCLAIAAFLAVVCAPLLARAPPNSL